MGHETLNRMFSGGFSIESRLSRNGEEPQQSRQGAMLISTNFLEGKLMKAEGNSSSRN